MDKYLTLQQAADQLAVSSATVKNWFKAGLIRNVVSQNGQHMVDKDEIGRIARLIQRGELDRLQKRRNKRGVQGRFIPVEYVSFKPYVQLTEDILHVAGPFLRTATPQQANRYIRLILCECALQLWRNKHISCGWHEKELEMIPTETGASLSQAWLDGLIQPGRLTKLLAGLIHRDKDDLSSDEKDLLHRLQHLAIPYVEGEDFLGLVYLSLSHLGQRKHYGQYYTPSSLVEEMVENSLEQLNITEHLKIMDPCCGSGNFLLKLFQHLKPRLCSLGFSPANAEKHLLQACLFGMDIDPVAVQLAKINLALTADSLPDAEPSLEIRVGNFLRDEYGLYRNRPDLFHLIVGNPPWGSTFDSIEKKELKARFVSARFLVDSFSLFVERAVSRLQPGGILNFVLPEAMLYVSGHRSIREYVLDHTHLIDIQLLGNAFSRVYSPVITLKAQRKASEEAGHCLSVRRQGKMHHIPQQRFKDNLDYVFNVCSTEEDHRLLHHLRTHPAVSPLKGKAAFALGIVTGNNKKFLVADQEAETEPIVKGSDIFKYRVERISAYIRFQPERFQQVAPLHYYRAPEKLIYRFINRTLVFAYDNRQRLTLNSANILVPETQEVDIKYLLAVLNSKTIQFFYQLSFSSVKVLRHYLEAIPIPQVSWARQGRIVELVNQLMAADEPRQRKEWYEEIEKEIMDLFDLNRSQQRHIEQTVSKLEYLD